MVWNGVIDEIYYISVCQNRSTVHKDSRFNRTSFLRMRRWKSNILLPLSLNRTKSPPNYLGLYLPFLTYPLLPDTKSSGDYIQLFHQSDWLDWVSISSVFFIPEELNLLRFEGFQLHQLLMIQYLKQIDSWGVARMTIYLFICLCAFCQQKILFTGNTKLLGF